MYYNYVCVCTCVDHYRDELKEKYEGKLSKTMTSQLYEVFSKVLRVLVGHEVTVPGTYVQEVRMVWLWLSGACACLHALFWCAWALYRNCSTVAATSQTSLVPIGPLPVSSTHWTKGSSSCTNRLFMSSLRILSV